MTYKTTRVKGKCCKTGKWIYGCGVIYVTKEKAHIIVATVNDVIEMPVFPITVMRDTTIEAPTEDETFFEGDILIIAKTQKVSIVWDSTIGGFTSNPAVTYCDWGWDELMQDKTRHIELIGNIIDNPELAP